jgi:hypothetical protein
MTTNESNRVAHGTEWEHNGYDDSDFFIPSWDGEQIVQHLSFSTRFAGGFTKPPEATDEQRLAARAWHKEALREAILKSEGYRVLEPGASAMEHGLRLRLLKDHTFQDKKSGGTPVEAREGDVGEVFWHGAFGTFYRKGYNQPNRENTRVGLRLRDGQRIFIPLNKLRLDEEPMTESEAEEKAEELSWKGWPWGSGARGYVRMGAGLQADPKLESLRPKVGV